MEPQDGWASDELKSIFSKTVPRDPSSGNQSTVPPTETTAVDSKDGSGSHRIGAGGIAGITIGAIAVVSITFGIIWLKRKQQEIAELPVTSGNRQPKELNASDTARHELDNAEARPHELPDSSPPKMHELE